MALLAEKRKMVQSKRGNRFSLHSKKQKSASHLYQTCKQVMKLSKRPSFCTKDELSSLLWTLYSATTLLFKPTTLLWNDTAF